MLLRNHDGADTVHDLWRGVADNRVGAFKVERGMAQESTAPVKPAEADKPLGQIPMFFIGSMVLLSLGYQLHFSVNSGPFFLRFAKPEDLQWLMPVFWIGFNIAMFPASVIVKHRGGLIVMGAAGLLGRAGGDRRRVRRRPEHVDRGAVHCGRGVGLHADERGRCRPGDRAIRR